MWNQSNRSPLLLDTFVKGLCRGKISQYLDLWKSWNLQLHVFLPYICYIPNLVIFGTVVLEKKMLTDDAQRTTDDDGRQPIAIGHPSDSGDLKRRS